MTEEQTAYEHGWNDAMQIVRRAAALIVHAPESRPPTALETDVEYRVVSRLSDRELEGPTTDVERHRAALQFFGSEAVSQTRRVSPWEPVSSPSTDEALRQLQDVMREYPPDWEAVSPPSPDMKVSPPSPDMKLVSYILNRGYDGSEEGLDAAIAEFEEAIRAEAEREWQQEASMAWEGYDGALAGIRALFEENRRLQTALEHAREVASEVADERDEAQEDRDKYRTVLEEAQRALALALPYIHVHGAGGDDLDRYGAALNAVRLALAERVTAQEDK